MTTTPVRRLIICRGLPGSGKTTFAQSWVDRAPSIRSRVNRDTVRITYFNAYWGGGIDETTVTAVVLFTTEQLMHLGRDVICDDTNLVADRLTPLLELAEKYGYLVEYRDFDVPLDELLARDLVRDKPVGQDVIRSLHERHFAGGIFPALVAPESARSLERTTA